MLTLRGVAQLGSASALGAEGRWFESSRPDQRNRRSDGMFDLLLFCLEPSFVWECVGSEFQEVRKNRDMFFCVDEQSGEP